MKINYKNNIKNFFTFCFIFFAAPVLSWLSLEPTFIIASGATYKIVIFILIYLIIISFIFANLTFSINYIFKIISNLYYFNYRRIVFSLFFSLFLINVFGQVYFGNFFSIYFSFIFLLSFYIVNTDLFKFIISSWMAPICISIIFLLYNINFIFSEKESYNIHKNISDNKLLIIIFDEFPLFSILKDQNTLLPQLKNFNELLESSYWVKHTASSHSMTNVAIPMMLSGSNSFFKNNNKVNSVSSPTHLNYQDNLLNITSPNRKLVYESITDLCSGIGCVDKSDYKNLFYDVLILLLYKILPPDYNYLLPNINNKWNDFLGLNKPRKLAFKKFQTDRVSKFDDFVKSINLNKDFVFFHTLLPHDPYEYALVSKYKNVQYPKYNKDQKITELGEYIEFQRYFDQLMTVDLMLGSLIKFLKENDMWDSFNIIVTADHGKSFRRGFTKRELAYGNLSDVIDVPLFIKLKNQKIEQI